MRVVIIIALVWMMVGSCCLGIEKEKTRKTNRMLKEDIELSDNNDHHRIPLIDYNHPPRSRLAATSNHQITIINDDNDHIINDDNDHHYIPRKDFTKHPAQLQGIP
ncbi:hypothetical protein G2W53_037777 [Senna tora]|uniref:Uncharacterized protein n=1 Tax=Senna tora TaxID=362788 RepID=A0A834SLJ6_9FABA|nr:hypothetical protein G2W53_037777 [Senna tora]